MRIFALFTKDLELILNLLKPGGQFRTVLHKDGFDLQNASEESIDPWIEYFEKINGVEV